LIDGIWYNTYKIDEIPIFIVTTYEFDP